MKRNEKIALQRFEAAQTALQQALLEYDAAESALDQARDTAVKHSNTMRRQMLMERANNDEVYAMMLQVAVA